MEQAVAAQPIGIPAIASAVSRAALVLTGRAYTVLTRAILRNYHGKRPGDRYVIFESQHFINAFHELRVAAMRAGRSEYDNSMPGMFAVGKLTVQTRSRPIAPYEIAPTLASYPGIEPPLGSIRCPLVEVLV